MVIFDANMLIAYMTEKEGSETFRKLDFLFESLIAKKTVIGFPTPALTEYLAGTGQATAETLDTIKGKRAIRILPFGEAEAIEMVEIGKKIAKATQKRKKDLPWQKVKYDRQILATAITNNADMLYTNDRNMIDEAKQLGLVACRIKDLPLPPENPQQEINFNG